MTEAVGPTTNRHERHATWLESVLPLHDRLTGSVVAILRNLLAQKRIEFLSISGRTKDSKSALEKIDRKSYRDPRKQLTDLSGIRIVVLVESDIERVSEIIKTVFSVDEKNSSNKDEILSPDQVGYRSVHFVCEVGSDRLQLMENEGLGGLQFEIQVRTVLQHAWAEITHDRSYKFKGDLPSYIKRKIFLHAGMLELADKGFAEILSEIEKYEASVSERFNRGDLNVDINTLSLSKFVQEWAAENNYKLVGIPHNASSDELVVELQQFGIRDISSLSAIIPPNFASASSELGIYTNQLGLIRTWMMAANPIKLLEDVDRDWLLADPQDSDYELLKKVMSQEDFDTLMNAAHEEIMEIDDGEDIDFNP